MDNGSFCSQQAELFYNRIKKRYKHLKKHARRLGIYAYRLYDKDIPEVPVSVDLYTQDESGELFAVLTEYERTAYKGSAQKEIPMQELTEALCAAVDIPIDHVYGRYRKRQRGDAQYEKLAEHGTRIIVREGNCRFFVNLSGYLDTGLFLDHRPTRLAIAETAAGKSLLNLFCYTAAFSIHALVGGAKKVCSVDLSKNYLHWAAENAQLNGVGNPARCAFEHSDVRAFLNRAVHQKQQWDIIICDPPTFSNSKRTPQFFDVNRHWQDIVRNCCTLLSPGGTLYFSTNSRTLRFSIEALADQPVAQSATDRFIYRNQLFTIEDRSLQSIPEDFRNKKIHRLWKITRVQR